MEQRRMKTTRMRMRIEKRQDDKGPGTLIGYGAVFYREGDDGTQFVLWPGVVERVGPKAFDKAVSAKDGDDVRGLFNHDTNHVLGRTGAGTMTLAIDDVGLRYEIDLADTEADRDLAAKIERGDVDGSSFSFDVRGESWETTPEGVEIRTLEDVGLYDVGPVVFPAYESTTSGVRAGNGLDDAKESHRRWKADQAHEARVRAVKARSRSVEVDGF